MTTHYLHYDKDELPGPIMDVFEGRESSPLYIGHDALRVSLLAGKSTSSVA
jgi:hypothetical protein